MIATLLGLLLLTQTPPAAVTETKPDARKDPNTRWADGSGTARDGLSIQSPVILLEWPQVRKELELSNEKHAQVIRAVNVGQKQWHDELTRKLAAKQLDMFGDALVIIEGKRQADYRAMATVMTKAQCRRLREIYLQVYGVHALVTNLELEDAFNLSDSQRENIKQAGMQYMKQTSRMSLETSRLKNAFKRSLGHPPSPEELRDFRIKNAHVFERDEKSETELEATLIREINRQLTKRQRAAFEKAKGEPFDLDGMMTPGSRERTEQKEAERKAKEKTADKG